MKIYTIAAGVNGTGKSSLTGVLKCLRTDLGIMIDGNKIAAENHGNMILAGRIAVQRIRDCISRGICFTQETTLSGALTARTARAAKEQGYYIRMFYVGLSSAEESLQRIANRVRKGGHGIPEEDVRRRFAKRAQALSAVLPYCDEAVFFDNENGFVEAAYYQNGEIACRPDAAGWMRELASALQTLV